MLYEVAFTVSLRDEIALYLGTYRGLTAPSVEGICSEWVGTFCRRTLTTSTTGGGATALTFP